MKMNKILLALTFSATSLAFGSEGHDHGFSKEDLLESLRLAAEAFDEINPTMEESIAGYKVWKSKKNARVNVFYSEDGQSKTAKFNCHKHDDAIECHDL